MAVVEPLVSTSPALTVLLAVLILREALPLEAWLAVGGILAGDPPHGPPTRGQGHGAGEPLGVRRRLGPLDLLHHPRQAVRLSGASACGPPRPPFL